MKYRSLSDMDGWFQMVSSTSKCWSSIINLALTVAEKWTLTPKTEPKSPSAPDVHAGTHVDACRCACGCHGYSINYYPKASERRAYEQLAKLF